MDDAVFKFPFGITKSPSQPEHHKMDKFSNAATLVRRRRYLPRPSKGASFNQRRRHLTRRSTFVRRAFKPSLAFLSHPPPPPPPSFFSSSSFPLEMYLLDQSLYHKLLPIFLFARTRTRSARDSETNSGFLKSASVTSPCIIFSRPSLPPNIHPLPSQSDVRRTSTREISGV